MQDQDRVRRRGARPSTIRIESAGIDEESRGFASDIGRKHGLEDV